MNQDIPEGYYAAKPTECGMTRSKNGHEQFAIECAFEVPDDTAPEGKRTVHLTKFGGLDGEGLEYTVRDAETVGCDTSLDIREWRVDPTRVVRVKVVIDGEWGAKLKSIFPADGAGGGALIRKQAMDEAQKASVAERVNARIAALKARGGGATHGRNAAAPPRNSGKSEPAGFGRDVDDSEVPF